MSNSAGLRCVAGGDVDDADARLSGFLQQFVALVVVDLVGKHYASGVVVVAQVAERAVEVFGDDYGADSYAFGRAMQSLCDVSFGEDETRSVVDEIRMSVV